MLYELYKFVAVVITMGIIDMPTIKHYQSGKKTDESSFSSKLFTTTRVGFELIFHTMFHIGTNAQAEGKDKIKPFMNALIANFNHAFYPFQKLSLDELVIGWTGRWMYKQYNAVKQKKYHIKTFGLCNASTGYVINILTYFGKNASYSQESDAHRSMAVKVFQSLLEVVGQRHHFFADRYYTKHILVNYLKENLTYYRGTLITTGMPVASDKKAGNLYL
ncbi:PiggyBac transposable element-derived protein 4-like [Plakobranchus ocellatus]|uniref:PiggyBac transposable element-derived protein 4-like n=1 Tax=Plakobranchus ocellatus TaxID=259542 RepID=A0AAV4ARI2_9GAST|nr:PiggyBac transposable element-derived protein 4-like [Plakobranchus ocellatus]